MTDAPVRTELLTADGWLEFQEYFVHRHHADAVTALRYRGAEAASPTAEVLGAIEAADLMVLAPSNPFLSIGAILAVPGIADALAGAPAPVVAVSPIVGGVALRGPADRLFETLGGEASALGVARHYQERYPGLVDALVIDTVDAAASDGIRDAGLEVLVTDTVMRDHADRERLAATIAATAGCRPADVTRPTTMAPVTSSAAARPLRTTLDPLHAVVPLRTLAGGKARLGEALDAEEREELVLGMLTQTLSLLSAWTPCVPGPCRDTRTRPSCAWSRRPP